MQDDIRRRFATLIEATGMNFKAASKEGGLGATYVRDVIERNRGSLENVLKIVEAIAPSYLQWVQTGRGSSPPERIEPKRSIERLKHKRAVSILGVVGQGGEVQPEADDSGDTLDVYAPEGTIALKIAGSSLGILYDGWHVIFADEKPAFVADLFDKLCVVGTKDGRTLVKVVRRGHGKGVQLVSGLGEVENNVDIDWATEVLSIQP